MDVLCFFVVSLIFKPLQIFHLQKKLDEKAVTELRSRVDALLGEVGAAQKEPL